MTSEIVKDIPKIKNLLPEIIEKDKEDIKKEGKIRIISKLNESKTNNSKILVNDSLNYQPGFGLWCIGRKNDNSISNKEIKKIIIENKLLSLNQHNPHKQQLIVNNKNNQSNDNININTNNNQSQDKQPHQNSIIDDYNNERYKEKQMLDIEILQMEDKINKKQIKNLKLKIEFLSNELEKTLLNLKESEMITNKERNISQGLVLEMKSKNNEIEKLNNKIVYQEETISNLNKALLSSKEEIVKNLNNIERLNEIIKLGKSKIYELELEFNRRKELLNEENKSLLSQLQKMSTMIDEDSDYKDKERKNLLMVNLKNNSHKNNVNENKTKIEVGNEEKGKEDEKEKEKEKDMSKFLPPIDKLKTVEVKLQLEIVDLKDRIEKLEESRRVLDEGLKKKRSEVVNLKKQMIKLIDITEETRKDSKWKEKALKNKRYENSLLKSRIEEITIKNERNKSIINIKTDNYK